MTASSIRGELLLDDNTIENPYPFYRRLVADAPVWQAGDADVFVVSGYDALAEAARRVEDFSSHLKYLLYRTEDGLPARYPHGPADLHVLATADPPDHAVHRRLMIPAFTPARLAALETLVAELTENLVRSALARGRTEFMSTIATGRRSRSSAHSSASREASRTPSCKLRSHRRTSSPGRLRAMSWNCAPGSRPKPPAGSPSSWRPRSMSRAKASSAGLQLGSGMARSTASPPWRSFTSCFPRAGSRRPA